MTTAPILSLSGFDKLFDIECNAANMGTGTVLSQERKHIVFFSENLNDACKSYSTYDKELCSSSSWSKSLEPISSYKTFCVAFRS